MAQIRFPEDLNGFSDPWIVFSTQRPRYDRSNRSTGEIRTEGGSQVALYFPTNHTISDSINYESQEEGMTGRAINRLQQQGADISDITKESVQAVAEGIGRGVTRGAAAALPGGSVIARNQGRVTNPKEFMMFKSPGIREFSFEFTFIPQSEQEAESVTDILRFFRSAAYPEEAALEYKFPDTFNISYRQALGGIIKIPEVACTAISVVYNPNSISFFRNNGMPVETNLSLSFTELRPISKQLVEQGF
jgi:hypothetical protein